jgi:hypothetical protein
LSDFLPTTGWGAWASYPDAVSAQPLQGTTMPAPLANGGLYTGPQSTGEWASQPFPATQQAWAIEASKVSQTPEVGYHQRPTDNWGANPGPYNSVPLSISHYSAGLPPQNGGRRKTRRAAHKNRRRQ